MKCTSFFVLWWLLAAVFGQDSQADEQAATDAEHQFREARHTNNWAVLVSTSRFWFNYRHMANVLSFYRTVKRLGIPDDQIIVMLSDDISCNPRNPYVGSVFKDHEHGLDLYGNNIEVDYRGYEVTVQNFVRLLTDRWDEEMPRSKRLMSDDRSNVLVYLTGHGGNDFLKFQDADDIGAWDLADAFNQMWEKRRYNELLFLIDTCEANTMYSKLFSPNIIAVGSSQLAESSYADYPDDQIGVALIDRFTSLNLKYLEQVDKTSNLTLADLFNSYDPNDMWSHPGIRSDLFPHALDQVRITDFFGNIQDVALEDPHLDLSMNLRAIMEKNSDGTGRNTTVFDSIIENQSSPGKKNTSQEEDKPKTALRAKNVKSLKAGSNNIFMAATFLGIVGLLLVGLKL